MATIAEIMSKWGRQFILEANPELEIPEDAHIHFSEDNWAETDYGTFGEGSPYVQYSVHVTWVPPLPKRKSVTRTYTGSFGELIDSIQSWEDEAE